MKLKYICERTVARIIPFFFLYLSRTKSYIEAHSIDAELIPLSNYVCLI